MEFKAKRSKHQSKQCIFNEIDDVVLCELVTGQIEYVILSFPSFYHYAGRDSRVCESLLMLFQDCGVQVTLVTTGRKVHPVLQNVARRTNSSNDNMVTSTTLEMVLSLH